MVLWNNIDLRKKGIIVEKTPTISKGKKRIDTYTIEGRDGFVSIDSGNYDPFVVSVECHFDPMKTNLDEIKTFLDGYGVVSFDGKREYTAIIQNSIPFEKVARFRSFLIQFLCNPIAYEISSETVKVDSSSFSFNISEANYKMYPIIKITGTGNIDITINNKTFKLLDISGECLLDCENQVITQNSINISNKMLYNFPSLAPGKNIINYSGNVTEFTITYRKAYL